MILVLQLLITLLAGLLIYSVRRSELPSEIRKVLVVDILIGNACFVAMVDLWLR